MPLYVKAGHEVNVSGEEEVARFEAAGYSLVAAAKPSEKAPAKKAAAKPSEKAPAKKAAAKPSEKAPAKKAAAKPSEN